ncbi:MAG: mechanosensitive ion channel [Acidobacteriota bacterium]|nr:mechanosensitive ion channel [Acidobacteriota bacterium]
MQEWFGSQGAVLRGGVLLLVAIGAALVVHRIVFAGLRRLARPGGRMVDDSLLRHGEAPARLILPILAAFIALPGLGLPPHAEAVVRQVVALGTIASFTWLSIALTEVFQDLVAARYVLTTSDNLAARKVQTQVQVLRRVLVFIILIVGLSVGLMTFPAVRQFGATLFASAGLAGLVVGMAARPALANLLAGLQIAMTEPIRIDDVVIVEGEWGRIEEITTTYVVVRIWDLRRLIVPLSYFIEHPFQNWTRQTADLLGTVMIYADYTVPVDEVRQELHRILAGSADWDRKVWGLQVTDTTDRTIALRALMSAADSGKAWDLRCLVRERLIAFLQANYPHCLPRARAEVQGLSAA